jgi:hypothetical protein
VNSLHPLVSIALVVALSSVLGCSSCTSEPPLSCSDTQVLCEERCVNPRSDRRHCGGCGQACAERAVCLEGACQACAETESVCFGRCASLSNDLWNCGACGARCEGGTCVAGGCVCMAPTTFCPGGCFDLASSKQHCGTCAIRCLGNEVCDGGLCELSCPTGLAACNGLCIDTLNDAFNCGACDRLCARTERCDAGTCATPPDLDGDGFTIATGDCCETTAQCAMPAQVNPGAVEVLTNGVDDDCDGVIDRIQPDGGCDEGLRLGSAADAGDYARALDICEGFISAAVKRVDGTPSPLNVGIGIHDVIGGVRPSTGRTMLALGSGRANVSLSSFSFGTPVSVATCAAPGCVRDWFSSSNGSLKTAGRLPSSPSCTAGSADDKAFDSVMLHLRLKAPSSARAFSLISRFYSLEYPEYVCSPFNDQVVILTSSTAANPPDKNLMTFTSRGQAWPIGINVAAGTPLFQACETKVVNPRCWDNDVSADSCLEGPAVLAGTLFNRARPMDCLSGGATTQLLTRGNVNPGEEFELRIAIWDVGDPALDSFVVLDSFTWLTNTETPGTVGTRVDGGTID